MNVAKNIFIILLIIILLGLAVKQQIDLNTLRGEREALEQQLEALKYENDKKQSELDLPEEERMRAAAEKSGYRDPNARYYYNDLNNPD